MAKLKSSNKTFHHDFRKLLYTSQKIDQGTYNLMAQDQFLNTHKKAMAM